MNIGDIVHLNWSPNAGTEMAGKHFGVVLSSQKFNDIVPRVLVAPITTPEYEEFNDFRVPVETFSGTTHGYICLDQIRSIDPTKREFSVEESRKLTPACKRKCREIILKIFNLGQSTPA